MLGMWSLYELYESNGPAHHPSPLENRQSRRNLKSLNREIMFIATQVTQVVPVIARRGINLGTTAYLGWGHTYIRADGPGPALCITRMC